MPSGKGIPPLPGATDPKLRGHLEEGKAMIPYLGRQQEPNKSGDGKGQWAAWKGMKLAREYEAHSGSYEDDPGSENEPKTGAPVAKSESKKKA
ncbi:hypothetical protein CHGG_06128 [Chaetomium globosum CBS 148.51]|uniref:Uncharacterized protein n=1 Tax=Chaetomium globosum (strain ATCC 6205 / CBS 148.51 / DSM 1962 / NBRC 6347 / NRRL 1970) TaxID=306901 RepID=Q2H5D7_CHAGB|nr:uncharacterized protein CHGG_06128 [Chaetomium globosum CBS 148.51]EAQ89509.1 hypothetical protein CHGG_06128 [Chaetomium globosum CBS 148.51]